MTDQSHRQNGDGLLQCPFCKCTGVRLEEIVSSGEWRVRCERCGCQTCWWHSELDARRYWNNRPTRDGAEGAERRMVAEIPFDPTNHHNALKCPYCNPEGLIFAPPKPAPDAMRLTDRELYDNSCITRHQLANWVDSDYASHIGGLKHTIEFLFARLDTLSSAPVPPADGAAAKLADRAEGCLNSRNSAYPSDVLRECIAFLRFLPLGAGAAEPVACISAKQAMTIGISIAEKHKTAVLEILSLITDGKTPLRSSFEKALHGNLVWLASEIMVALQAATPPPVRGDRETLLWASDVAAKRAKQCSDGDSEWHQGFRYAAQNTALGIAADLRHAALSLPVQSTARPDREAFYTILKKYVPEESIDQAWQELKEAGGVQPGAGELEQTS